MKRAVAVLVLCLLLLLGCSASPITPTEVSYDAGRVHKATMEEVYDFVVLDRTDEGQLSEHYCGADFAADLWKAAYDAGIDAFVVALFDESDKAERFVVGFWIKDVGYEDHYIIVEPQTDTPMDIDGRDNNCFVGKEAFEFWEWWENLE